MIVVDTNIVTYRFVQGEKTELVLHAVEIDGEWVVPELSRHEFLNVLVTFGRHGTMSASECSEIWGIAEPFLEVRERPVDMAAALALALRESLTTYDAQYVTLARALGVRCLTEDRALLKACPEVAISLEEFCSSGMA